TKFKLEKRSIQGFLVGYGIGKLEYRVWIPELSKVVTTRDIKLTNIFYGETEFSNSTFSTNLNLAPEWEAEILSKQYEKENIIENEEDRISEDLGILSEQQI
ncbi:hypothetical protein HMI54_011191, partial [Coelomomyces lativittatus]